MKKLNTIDADTLQTIAYKPLTFLVEDLLPQGLHLLAGAPKIGKSWLALWLCLRVAWGEPLWNFPTHPCEVLYLCLEDSFQRIQSRLFDLTEDAPPTLYFAVMAEQLHSGLVEQIEQFLKEHPATGLVVIDTLQRIRTVSNDVSPYANDYRDIGVLKALADRHRIAVLLVHHLRKLGDDDPMNMISGTTGLSGATDSNFVLRKSKRRENTATLYAELRETVSTETKKPLSEYTVEGVHATLCSILSDAVEGGFLRHNPAWRTYRYAGRKTEKKIADAETVGKIISALEDESIKYETYFKLVIATGMRRGECCALQWGDIDWEQRSIHIHRNAVKVTDEEIFTKAPKTVSGNRYVYFSLEMESLLREYRQECAWETETYDGRELENGDFLFRRKGCRLPMTPSTFTWRFKLILKKHGLPEYLNVHSLRHTNASLLIANGTDVATVAGLLGHSQPSTTLDIYTHAFDKNKQAASRVLQEGLEI